MRKGRHKTTYKPNHELSRFALICDKLNLANVPGGHAVYQTTHCGRKQSELSKCARWPMSDNPFVMHSYLTLSCLLHLRCTEDYNRLYCLHICKLLNSLIFIKRHISTLSFVVTVLLVVCVRFIWPSCHISIPNT